MGIGIVSMAIDPTTDSDLVAIDVSFVCSSVTSIGFRKGTFLRSICLIYVTFAPHLLGIWLRLLRRAREGRMFQIYLMGSSSPVH